MRFGVQTWTERTCFEELLATWRLIDQLAFDSAFVCDHLLPVLDKPSSPCLEAWTLLAALARETRRLRLGVLVSANSFRSPSLLAKMAATVDQISGGRLIMGLGAAWAEREHLAYGIPFYPAAERVRRLEEAAEIIRLLWTGSRSTLAGRYYSLNSAHCAPRPLQHPRPPILIGGLGEKLMLRVVAKHADVWNTRGTVETFIHKSKVLRRYCEEIGRNFEEIEISWTGWGSITSSQAEAKQLLSRIAAESGMPLEDVRKSSLIGSAAEIEQSVNSLIAAGVTYLIISVRAPFDNENLSRFSAEIVSRFL